MRHSTKAAAALIALLVLPPILAAQQSGSIRGTIISAPTTQSNGWHLESFSVGADVRQLRDDFNEADLSTSDCLAALTCGSVTRHVSSGDDRALSGAFIQAIAAPMQKLRLDATGRVDQVNKTAGAFSPRLGAHYQLFSTFSVNGAAYKAFRAPNLSELYRKQVTGGEAYVAMRPMPQLFVSAGVNYDDARQQSGLPAGTPSANRMHVNRAPSPRQTIRGTWSSPLFGDWTATWRREGRATTLQGIGLDPYTVLDANAQRELRPGLRAFVSVENVGNKHYQVNVSGTGTAANPRVVTNGLPRTFRVGVEAYRF